ncbi:MAG: O-antigen ligase family protein [Galbibacter orientalis]|uniref:O-antigen ligase family protein n=1 Tax=Galbibacter orientalis TaxID=453852 RepID=UPI00300211A1
MVVSIKNLDKFILILLSYVVLIDMINGFFMMEFSKILISQFFKLLILILFFLRLSTTKYFSVVLVLFFAFQIGAIFGLLKTGSFTNFNNDMVVATKWFNVPLSFFYFKTVLKTYNTDYLMINRVNKFIIKSFKFLSINMLIGMCGFGMAYYNHGYSNAIGTRGYIYAGNELTILLLAITFPIALNYYLNKDYKKFFLLFGLTLFYAFLMTSKTVLGGVLIIFAIPPISQLKFRIKKKWIDYFILFIFIGIPVLCYIFYLGITKMGVVDKITHSMQRNNNEILTVILSNRNNFIKNGWEVFVEEYNWIEKFFGLGQSYHLQLSGHLAEVDFFSLLFASGILGLSCLILLVLYWLFISYKLMRLGRNYAKATFVFIFFITIISNLSGHIYGSGIAGYFIGFCIALMYYKTEFVKANG